MANQSSLINFESKIPYLLTPEEEEKAIKHAMQREIDQQRDVMRGLGYQKMQIDERIANLAPEELINISEVLQYANICKEQNNWHESQEKLRKEKLLEEKNRLKNEWTSERMFRFMQVVSQEEFNKKLILTKENKKFIAALCHFVSRDERFHSEMKFNPKKGLLIRGVAGIGKTYLPRCIADNPLNPIAMYSMIEISEEMKTSGEFVPRMGDRKILYLDDVGTEESSVKHFGTVHNFFKDFIEGVYFRNKEFSSLMISTNLTGEELEKRYGYRVRSRMREMFNVIDVEGEDMRN